MIAPQTDGDLRDFELRSLLWQTETNALPPIRWVDSRATADVSVEQALTVTAIFACARFLSETLASMPVHLYRRDGDGRVRVTDHPMHRVLCERPNHWQSCYEYTEQQI